MIHPDRCFDVDPTVRRAARELYESTRSLPIVSPHGHVEARILATNEAFENPTALLVTPDHYVLRMLYARGVSLESLGVPRRDGAPVQSDPRAIWRLFAQHFSVFRATPSGMWLDHELHDLFGVRVRLAEDNADGVYDAIAEKLASPEFRPRALFERFDIEVLATTDLASDTLEHHTALKRSGWKGRVIPTFRPDSIFRLTAPGWRQAVNALATTIGAPIGDYDALVDALAERRTFFKWMGATASDHGVVEPYTT
ncbi:MAG TPA: glucuronate isomerase, partial [Gemmatimonadaceae bacterium]|nr:glucuronate isomerase [Gemmatimonadaceae bacterium]